MFELLATLAVLVVGGMFLAFVAVTGLLVVSLIKLVFLPMTLALDLVKWTVLIIVVPVIVFIVIPVVLLVLVPVVLGVLVPILLLLAVFAAPLLIAGLVGLGIAQAASGMGV